MDIKTHMEIAEQSDHRPIWALYMVLGGRCTQGQARKGKANKRLKLLCTELTLKDKAEVQSYQDIISEKFSEENLQDNDAAEIIHHLSKLSYDAAQEAQLDKKHRPEFRLPYKDGWSPEAMAHIAHLRSLIEIRRHINGFQKRRKWKANTTQLSADIKRMVKKWKQAVMNKEKEIKNAWALMDITGRGPQQLLTYSQLQIQHCIEGQIVCVRNLLHGKLQVSSDENIGKDPRRTTGQYLVWNLTRT